MVCVPFPKRMNSWETSGAAENNCAFEWILLWVSVQKSPLAGAGKQSFLIFVFPDCSHFSSKAQFLERVLLHDIGEDTLPCAPKNKEVNNLMSMSTSKRYLCLLLQVLISLSVSGCSQHFTVCRFAIQMAFLGSVVWRTSVLLWICVLGAFLSSLGNCALFSH